MSPPHRSAAIRTTRCPRRRRATRRRTRRGAPRTRRRARRTPPGSTAPPAGTRPPTAHARRDAGTAVSGPQRAARAAPGARRERTRAAIGRNAATDPCPGPVPRPRRPTGGRQGADLELRAAASPAAREGRNGDEQRAAATRRGRSAEPRSRRRRPQDHQGEQSDAGRTIGRRERRTDRQGDTEADTEAAALGGASSERGVDPVREAGGPRARPAREPALGEGPQHRSRRARRRPRPPRPRPVGRSGGHRSVHRDRRPRAGSPPRRTFWASAVLPNEQRSEPAEAGQGGTARPGAPEPRGSDAGAELAEEVADGRPGTRRRAAADRPRGRKCRGPRAAHRRSPGSTRQRRMARGQRAPRAAAADAVLALVVVVELLAARPGSPPAASNHLGSRNAVDSMKRPDRAVASPGGRTASGRRRRSVPGRCTRFHPQAASRSKASSNRRDSARYEHPGEAEQPRTRAGATAASGRRSS